MYFNLTPWLFPRRHVTLCTGILSQNGWKVDAATNEAHLRGLFASWTSRDSLRGYPCWLLQILLCSAKKDVPTAWELCSGKYSFAIIVPLYVMDDAVANSTAGFLVTLDYNHGRVECVEGKRFVRLPDTDLPNLHRQAWIDTRAW